MTPIPLTILGSSGKMGKRLIELIASQPRFKIAGTCGRGECPSMALESCAVAIDFSHASATLEYLAAAVALKKPLVLGTTGHDTRTLEEIHKAAKIIPILFSSNFSFGIAFCLETVKRLAQALGDTVQIHITETHHITKKDIPSGTALTLAQAADIENKGTIPIHSIREADVIGEHRIVFEWGEERLEIKHQALNRDAFAQGALNGAAFLIGKAPGLYTGSELPQEKISRKLDHANL
jgi:4-hydroxy-tetrahydrodipicolinate reductase